MSKTKIEYEDIELLALTSILETLTPNEVKSNLIYHGYPWDDASRFASMLDRLIKLTRGENDETS